MTKYRETLYVNAAEEASSPDFEKSPSHMDISIPYDAPALLAFEQAGSKGDFETFKAQYVKDAVAMVIAKKVAREGGSAPVAQTSPPAQAATVLDISIPYDAPALLAFEQAGSKGDFATFKAQYVKDTVAMVTAKRAAALLAK